MPEPHEQMVSLNVTLTPVGPSDQPVAANYSTVGVAQGTAVQKDLAGKLVVRVALPLDVLQRLQQQVGQVFVRPLQAKGKKP